MGEFELDWTLLPTSPGLELDLFVRWWLNDLPTWQLLLSQSNPRSDRSAAASFAEPCVLPEAPRSGLSALLYPRTSPCWASSPCQVLRYREQCSGWEGRVGTSSW